MVVSGNFVLVFLKVMLERETGTRTARAKSVTTIRNNVQICLSADPTLSFEKLRCVLSLVTYAS